MVVDYVKLSFFTIGWLAITPIVIDFLELTKFGAALFVLGGLCIYLGLLA